MEELKSLHEELRTEAERKGRLLQGALSIHTFLTEASLQLECFLSICGPGVCELTAAVRSGVGAGAVAGGAAGRVGVS